MGFSGLQQLRLSHVCLLLLSASSLTISAPVATLSQAIEGRDARPNQPAGLDDAYNSLSRRAAQPAAAPVANPTNEMPQREQAKDLKGFEEWWNSKERTPEEVEYFRQKVTGAANGKGQVRPEYITGDKRALKILHKDDVNVAHYFVHLDTSKPIWNPFRDWSPKNNAMYLRIVAPQDGLTMAEKHIAQGTVEPPEVPAAPKEGRVTTGAGKPGLGAVGRTTGLGKPGQRAPQLPPPNFGGTE